MTTIRRLAAILAADVAGYSAMMGELGVRYILEGSVRKAGGLESYSRLIAADDVGARNAEGVLARQSGNLLRRTVGDSSWKN